MFRLLVLCAVVRHRSHCGRGDAIGEQREWTDASGTKRAMPFCSAIEGDTLWLRRSDGELTTTSMSRLSEHDRQYVALRHSQSRTNLKSPSVPSSTIESVTETIQQLPQWLEQSQLGA